MYEWSRSGLARMKLVGTLMDSMYEWTWSGFARIKLVGAFEEYFGRSPAICKI